MAQHKEFRRIRGDTGQHRRILLTALLLGILAFVPVVLRLFALLVAHWWSAGWSMLLHGVCLSRINLPIAALNEY